jgi:glycosyltransferase involved in cell wall biosynthesis
LKILLSAYACEPNKGSEPEVGWQWALTLSKRGHQVYVVTRKNNKKNIDRYLKVNKSSNLHFIYFDYPNWILKIIKGKSNANAYLYILLWQIGIYFTVKPYLNKIKFDFIHHVTFVSLRFPSFLCLYNIPFIYGPLAGGEIIPHNLRKKFSFKVKINEFLRDLSNLYIRLSPLVNLTLLRAQKIYVTSQETKRLLHKKYHHKTRIILGIGINNSKILRLNYSKKSKIFKICFVGNLQYLKGILILINIISKLIEKNMNIHLSIAGDGPQKFELIKIVEKLNIRNYITFLGKIKKNEIDDLYKNSDLLLFPSLRDSGGMVVLEAMFHGLPAAVLNLGGPGRIVNNKCGIKINLGQKNEDEVALELTRKIIKFIMNPNIQKIKKKESLRRVEKFSWYKKMIDVYGK